MPVLSYTFSKMDRWVNRIALVTGASGGIGAAVATVLVKHGLKVIGCGRNVGKIQELASQLEGNSAGGTLEGVRCDLRLESDISSMFGYIKEKYGGVDICVNNAGVAMGEPLLSGKTESWREMLDVNVLATSICTREAVKQMREKAANDGQVINMCSMSGHRCSGQDKSNFYAATKFAVRALTEGVRCELRKANTKIRISEISAGVVETEFFDNVVGEESAKKLFKALKQPLQPNDIADTVIYILSAPPHVQVHDVLLRPTSQAV